ncbi:ribosomal protection-like ABC-F family protein [Dyadobacter sandarakinus]|uniref:ABC-F family ATP-binding cassette domain-containing protein n=1 Tax=Dyadobacter sandarakinus TaxID=2747268 RepID=A0ABX7I2Q0_9BACT|nr:ABC-F family ATP-binding cassette domain-containing protein [Dyadobacter sandarakinus]QRR00104.1 ABC-F family ATP-binding cassette domain-containing protein [Dyadobacter sandarakinus]
MLTLHNLTYLHPNRELLLDDLYLTVNKHEKIALVGNNGSGKSTLLRIIAGELQPAAGQVKTGSLPYLVPQIFGQYNHLTIAGALRVDRRLHALQEILTGNVSEENLALLNDDWTIEERIDQALHHWQLPDLDLSQKLGTLSGGQKTKVFLAGITIHQPELILLDEPSNHLDSAGRQLLYDFIKNTGKTLVVVSHDRQLLQLVNLVCELDKGGISVYGGNYDFYLQQKESEREALNRDIQNREKALRKAEEKERETSERQQKLDARGRKKQEKAGVARIMINTLRNNAENSTSRLKSVDTEKIEGISQELNELRSARPDLDRMKFGFDHAALHKGKVLFAATEVNAGYGAPLWKENLTFQITSGERIAIRGTNGSGKTTLLRIILGTAEPLTGTVFRAESRTVYIDQDYSLINPCLNVYAQAQHVNTSALQEHEVKVRLSRFLFTKDDWDKPCHALSGGEKMRLALCCLTISSEAPDMIVLDEPTNNLDLQNIEILTAAIHEYRGTLLVVSHDEVFLRQVEADRILSLSPR